MACGACSGNGNGNWGSIPVAKPRPMNTHLPTPSYPISGLGGVLQEIPWAWLIAGLVAGAGAYYVLNK